MTQQNIATTPRREFKEIPIDRIMADPDNPRKEHDVEADENMERLLEVNPTIEQPLIVQETSTKNGGSYVLIDGERRYRAALKAGFPGVYCDVRKEMTDLERDITRAVLNFGRSNLSQADQVKFVTSAFKKWLKEKHNMTSLSSASELVKTEFATMIGISARKLSSMINVISDPVSMEHVKSGEPLYSVAYSTGKNEAETREILRTAKELERDIPASKKKKPGFRTKLPDRRTLYRARQTVQAERAPSKKEQNATAEKSILGWMDEVAIYNGSIRRNLRQINEIESMERISNSIRSQITVYNDLIKEAEKIFPTLRRR